MKALLPLAIPAVVLSSADGLTFGLALTASGALLIWAETRFKVTALREWQKEAVQQLLAQQARIAALESLTAVEKQRVDSVLTALLEVQREQKAIHQALVELKLMVERIATRQGG